MNYKLSLIIPVYNTEKYLKRCIDSVINQTCFEQIEVIIVNDGSTDNSQCIIDEFVGRFENIKSFAKVNGGLSDARNFGLQHITGEYVAFLDSDDWVDARLYMNCINYLDTDFDIEFVSFNYLEEWGTFQKIVDCLARIGRSKYFMGTIACNKVYRTNFWQYYKFEFTHGIKHEDTELIPKIIYYAKNYGFLGNEYGLLHYDKTNQLSITNSYRDTNSWVIVFERLREFCKDKNDPNLTKFVATTLFYQLVLFGGNPSKSYQVYCINRKFFSADNIISRPHNILKMLQTFHADFILKPIIYFLDKFSVDPNGFSV